VRAYHSAAAPQFPQLAAKTYAAHRVWKGSTREEVKFRPLGSNRKESRRAAREIWDHALRFERQTSRTSVDAFGRQHRQGKVGRMGLMVLRALLFKFLNHSSGRLDPSWEAIAVEAIVSRSSVYRALGKLKDCGILSWVKRCSESYDDSRYVLEQETNAYGVSPAASWRGYRAPPEAPPPDPDTWGAAPSLPALGLTRGDSAGRMNLALDGSGSALGAALASLGRRRL
jgi:hypothetical protein